MLTDIFITLPLATGVSLTLFTERDNYFGVRAIGTELLAHNVDHPGPVYATVILYACRWQDI